MKKGLTTREHREKVAWERVGKESQKPALTALRWTRAVGSQGRNRTNAAAEASRNSFGNPGLARQRTAPATTSPAMKKTPIRCEKGRAAVSGAKATDFIPRE